MTTWPADRIEHRPIAKLVPYANNARKHSDAQIEQIKAAIETFGWTIPVLIDDTGMIIAGHARVMAATRLGLDEVPVMIATGWTEEMIRAYVIADNQLALGATWDETLLADELHALKAEGFALELLGFDAPTLESLMFDPTFGAAGEDEQGQLDEKKQCICPACGHAFAP